MIQQGHPVTLILYSLPKGQSATLGAKGPVKLKNPPAVRPVNPKNLSPLNLLNPHARKGVSKGRVQKIFQKPC